MKALVLTSYDNLEVREIPIPPVGVDEVLVQTKFTGICGSDIHGFTGENGRRFPGQVMGHESEGLISQIGSGLDPAHYPVGTRVTFNPVVVPVEDAEIFAGREQHSPKKHVIGVRPDIPAAFADYVVVPARNIVPIPESAPPGAGALVEPLAVAVHAVSRARVAAGQKVLVVGGGPIGQSLVVALKLSGITQIVVSEPDPQRRELLAVLGARTVDPRSGESAVHEFVMSEFGALADVGFDAVGITETLSTCLSHVALGATICLVGMGARRLEFEAFAVSVGERSVIGSFTYSAEVFRTAASWIGQQGLGLENLISQVIDAQAAPAMFTTLASGNGPAGKVLVSFN